WRLRSRAALAPAWLAAAVSCRPASSSQSRPAGLGPRGLRGPCRVAGPASGMLRGGSAALTADGAAASAPGHDASFRRRSAHLPDDVLGARWWPRALVRRGRVRRLGGPCSPPRPGSGSSPAPGGYGLRCPGDRAVHGVPAGLVQLVGVGCSGGAEVTGGESQHVEDRPDADAVVRADPEDLDALPFPFTGPCHLPGRPPAAPEDVSERLEVCGCSQRSDRFSGPFAVAGLRAVFFLLVMFFVILRRHRCCLP